MIREQRSVSDIVTGARVTRILRPAQESTLVAEPCVTAGRPLLPLMSHAPLTNDETANAAKMATRYGLTIYHPPLRLRPGCSIARWPWRLLSGRIPWHQEPNMVAADDNSINIRCRHVAGKGRFSRGSQD